MIACVEKLLVRVVIYTVNITNVLTLAKTAVLMAVFIDLLPATFRFTITGQVSSAREVSNDFTKTVPI